MHFFFLFFNSTDLNWMFIPWWKCGFTEFTVCSFILHGCLHWWCGNTFQWMDRRSQQSWLLGICLGWVLALSSLGCERRTRGLINPAFLNESLSYSLHAPFFVFWWSPLLLLSQLLSFLHLCFSRSFLSCSGWFTIFPDLTKWWQYVLRW